MQHPSTTIPILPLSIDPTDKLLIVTWDNGRWGLFPYFYLRDNCPLIRHANGQKLVETATLDLSVHPISIVPNLPEGVHIKWDDGHDSYYSADWLRQHDLSPEAVAVRKEARAAGEAVLLWDASLMGGLPEASFNDVAAGDTALAGWLGEVRRYGFAVLHDVPKVAGTVLEVVKLFGYTRETNYGALFDVRTVINPNNLAFTSLGISPHTDNPYRDPVPTLQLLHCLQSSASGGDTVLVDGRKIAAVLKAEFPRWFELLSSTVVRFRFEDAGNLLEYAGPIIHLDDSGEFKAIRFNNRSIQPFELAAGDTVAFYEAYMGLARMLENPIYQVRFKMNAGDLYIVDNERVLHARTGYDDARGERWLQGAYADRDGLISKLKKLVGADGARIESTRSRAVTAVDRERAVAAVDRLFGLYESYGDQEYGERVTMLMHMMQAALMAEAEGEGDEMVLAAFVHDVGHFFEGVEKMGEYGTRQHDDIGGVFLLSLGFPERICRLVASHVHAKRYLCYAEPGYADKLSAASKMTLGYQGGPMDAAEAEAFRSDELFDAYIRIRYWDDLGKEVDVPVEAADLARMREKMITYLIENGVYGS